jgi:hypothetical protein
MPENETFVKPFKSGHIQAQVISVLLLIDILVYNRFSLSKSTFSGTTITTPLSVKMIK